MTEDQIIAKLLANRGLTTKKSIQEFFHPPHPRDLPAPFDSCPAIQLVKQHIKSGHKIIVYGDYDVDGITSAALLWETLYAGYPNVFPHIPHRREEGYGLSVKGIDHCLAQGAKLIITADNGITAVDQVKYCRDHDCDIIIIDHHEKGDALPDANCIIHSAATCAAGLSWFFCRDYQKTPPPLDLVCLAVICDLVPLLGINRSFAKHGLVDLNNTSRPGLLALFNLASLTQNSLTPYHVGFIIGPRLNAMGRLEHALDSLRLLCTHDPDRAHDLAVLLNDTNKNRQDLTQSAIDHALQNISLDKELIIAAHESYDEGIIGLVAARLVEKYHRPAIAISIGEKESKGSARSVPGFDITAYLRSYSNLFIAVGGHTMAAGFTVSTSKLAQFAQLAKVDIDPKLLAKTHRVDCELPLFLIRDSLFKKIQTFSPFGLGNPTPVFLTKNLTIANLRHMGKLSQHLKFDVDGLEAVYFNAADLPPNPVDITYSLDSNTWNGQTKLQLIIKEIQSFHGSASV